MWKNNDHLRDPDEWYLPPKADKTTRKVSVDECRARFLKAIRRKRFTNTDFSGAQSFYRYDAFIQHDGGRRN